MKVAKLLILLMLCGTIHAQFIAPYNPDSNADSTIGSSDLIDFLATFGYDFLPPTIELEGEDIMAVIVGLTEQVTALQNQVEQLQSAQLTQDSVIALTWLRNLRYTQLNGASMVDFDLNRVDFSHADMQGAQLMNSSFGDAVLQGTDLAGANLTNGDFDSAILLDANLSGATLTYAYFGYATLQGADLSGTDMSDTYLENTILTCLRGCPSVLPSDYICQSDPDCSEPDRYRILEVD